VEKFVEIALAGSIFITFIDYTRQQNFTFFCPRRGNIKS